MTTRDERAATDAEGVGLAEAVASIRADLLAARASGEGADIRLPVESVTVQLQVVATTNVDGRAGFKVPVVNLELGGGAGREWENTSTVTVVFGAPVDRAGLPVKVAGAGPERKG